MDQGPSTLKVKQPLDQLESVVMDSMDLDNVRGNSRNDMISIREEAQTPSHDVSMKKVNMMQQSSP